MRSNSGGGIREASVARSFTAHEYADHHAFWAGFGLRGCPPLAGMEVLEIGCGRGFRCIESAAHGARRVVGVDPYRKALEIARARLQAQPQAVRDRVRFRLGWIPDLRPEPRYDLILSENALEHVMDVPSLLEEAKRRLRPGGRMYIGFGPPYHAPDGDHGWLRATLPGYPFVPWPWGHLLFERYALRKLSERHGRPVTTTYDWPYLDLNRHRIEDYERMFRESGMRVVSLRKNQVRSWRGRLFAMAAQHPPLARYCTLNLHVILERGPSVSKSFPDAARRTPAQSGLRTPLPAEVP